VRFCRCEINRRLVGGGVLEFMGGRVRVLWFCIGCPVFTRRNLITMLMSIELMLNSVNINFVAFNKYLFSDQLDGLFFSLFIITIAAAEAAVAIEIIINLYRDNQSIDVDDATEMKF